MRARASFHVSPTVVFLERPLVGPVLFGWCVFACFLGWFLWFLLSDFVFKGLSSDKTFESTNDSLPGVAKTATIAIMSAAPVQKKNASSQTERCGKRVRHDSSELRQFLYPGGKPCLKVSRMNMNKNGEA